MPDLIPKPRSIYAMRLGEFPGIAWDEQKAWELQGRWKSIFLERIGPAFNGKIIFEIGCFDANFLCRIAAKNPRTAFVGLDWKCKAIHTGAGRIAGMGLKNVALIRGRAQHISRIFAGGEVNEIWLFHPDPCDTEVELNNRLVQEPFLLDAHRVLHDAGSTFCLKTDHAGYYRWVLALFGLSQPEGLPEPLRSPRKRREPLVPAHTLPPASAAIQERCAVAFQSADYWNDPAALAHTAGRAFSGETSLFERRFIRRKGAIYYFEFTKLLVWR